MWEFTDKAVIDFVVFNVVLTPIINKTMSIMIMVDLNRNDNDYSKFCTKTTMTT